MEFLVFRFLIGRWSVHLVGGWLVGGRLVCWQVVGGRWSVGRWFQQNPVIEACMIKLIFYDVEGISKTATFQKRTLSHFFIQGFAVIQAQLEHLGCFEISGCIRPGSTFFKTLEKKLSRNLFHYRKKSQLRYSSRRISRFSSIYTYVFVNFS